MWKNPKFAALAIAVAAFVGCGGPTPPVTSADPGGISPPAAPGGLVEPAIAPTAPPPDAGASAAPIDADPEEQATIAAAIAELPAEDQVVAKAQRFCLISKDAPLGSMKKPVRVEHEGKVGFLCCKGCLKEFNADPAAAFAMKTP